MLLIYMVFLSGSVLVTVLNRSFPMASCLAWLQKSLRRLLWEWTVYWKKLYLLTLSGYSAVVYVVAVP